MVSGWTNGLTAGVVAGFLTPTTPLRPTLDADLITQLREFDPEATNADQPSTTDL